MTFALIKNGQVAEYPYSLTTFRATNPNVSLPEDPTEAQLNEQGIYTVYPVPKPSYNSITQNCTEGTPESVDGKWHQVWLVSPATPQEIAARESEARQLNKNQASELLSQTDWTTIPDVSDPAVSNPYLANATEFVTYRNQVRQIAVYPPVVVEVWPVQPQEVWATV